VERGAGRGSLTKRDDANDDASLLPPQAHGLNHGDSVAGGAGRLLARDDNSLHVGSGAGHALVRCSCGAPPREPRASCWPRPPADGSWRRACTCSQQP